MEKKLLNIAYLSYEYPPDTNGGGIGTYTEQVTSVLSSNGHTIFVFCGTFSENYHYKSKGIDVYRIHSDNPEDFRNKVVEVFNEIHKKTPFDIIESPDYGADGYNIKRQHPGIPYVVKLHTPTYIIQTFNNHYIQYTYPYIWRLRLKHFLFFSTNKYKKDSDIEYLNVQLADRLISPSKALAKKVSRDWNIPLNNISIVPNPYKPIDDLLNTPNVYNHNRITFVGKLSILKGAYDFIQIIPDVIQKMSYLRFRFIGDDSYSPEEGKTMKELIMENCKKYKSQIEFVGKVPLDKIPNYLSQTDIVICNSLWENYPTVILEAMSAGRVVIATKAGGIPEIISNKKDGFLVNPKSPKDISRLLKILYAKSYKMQVIGAAGRKKILLQLNLFDSFNKIVDSYRQTIISFDPKKVYL